MCVSVCPSVSALTAGLFEVQIRNLVQGCTWKISRTSQGHGVGKRDSGQFYTLSVTYSVTCDVMMSQIDVSVAKGL